MTGRNRRRIGLITSQAFSLVNFRATLIREAAARGDIVAALAPDFDDETRSQVLELGAKPVDISMSRASLSPLRDAADVVRLAITLRRLNLDTTLSYFIKPVIYGLIAARIAGVRHRFALIEGVGHVFGEGGEAVSFNKTMLRRAVEILYRISLDLAERVFVLNPDDEALIGALAGTPKVVLLGAIGVDLERYQPIVPRVSPVVFVMSARLLRQKGVGDYVEAARRVRARYPSVRFILLGAPDVNPDSFRHHEIQRWADEGVIEWPGHVPDVRPWLRQASVFVLPSYYREGVPRSVQEAMALGLPVITTDWIGCRETVEENRNGFLVPIRDPGALAAAMLRFVENSDLIKSMGAESRQMAVAKFDARVADNRLLLMMGMGD